MNKAFIQKSTKKLFIDHLKRQHNKVKKITILIEIDDKMYG
jgi:hypothetical protein